MKILSVLAAITALLFAGCSTTTNNSSTSPSGSSTAERAFESVLVSDAFYMGKFETMNHEFSSALNDLFEQTDADTSAIATDTVITFLRLDPLTNDTLRDTLINAIAYRMPGLRYAASAVTLQGRSVWQMDTACFTVAQNDITLRLDSMTLDSNVSGVTRVVTKRRHVLRSIVFTPVDTKKNYPVTGANWYGAALFCNAKSGMDGYSACYSADSFVLQASAAGWRLPDTAQWVLAARAGRSADSSVFPTGPIISEWMANYLEAGNLASLMPVASYPSNPDSLFDMAGNLWEWCADVYSAADTSRVIKGGSYADGPDFQRTAFVSRERSVVSSLLIGFRVIRKK
ncbi:MAG: SUMF1/EgtB/PvdO family nonheme iron enzyme [Fibrobacterota bacterium]